MKAKTEIPAKKGRCARRRFLACVAEGLGEGFPKAG
jgi:hypothetical protein